MPTINFFWDDVGDNVVAELDANNQITTTYACHPEKHGEVFYDKQGNRFSYYHYDGNGSTRKLTGANQAVTKTYIFTGFGELVASPGVGSTPFAYKGAAGYYTNPVTNDIYVRAQTYQPTTGRWLQKYPSGIFVGRSFYEFCCWAQDNQQKVEKAKITLRSHAEQQPTKFPSPPCGGVWAAQSFSITVDPANAKNRVNGFVIQIVSGELTVNDRHQAWCYVERWPVTSGEVGMVVDKKINLFGDVWAFTGAKPPSWGSYSQSGRATFVQEIIPGNWPEPKHRQSGTLPSVDLWNCSPHVSCHWLYGIQGPFLERELGSEWSCGECIKESHTISPEEWPDIEIKMEIVLPEKKTIKNPFIDDECPCPEK